MLLEYSIFLFRAFFQILFWRLIRSDLERENLLLLRENQILKRKIGRVQLTPLDREFYMTVSRYSRKLLKSIVIIRPETVLGWHKKMVNWKWDQRSKRVGRPPLSPEICKLVVEMKKNNPRWGSQRIMAEMLKLDLKICKASVIKILREAGYDPWECRTGLSWKGFIKSHGKRLMACDFFTFDTLFLKKLHVFFVIDITTRKIAHWAVQEKPNAFWLRNQFRSFFAFAKESDKPEILIADRDGIYSNWMGPFLKEHYGIELRTTPPSQPIFNCFAERMVRTFRRELIDHTLIFNQRDLERIVREFVQYYNFDRLHAGVEFQVPGQIQEPELSTSKKGAIQSRHVVEGLITSYSRASSAG